jgi:hypothetical protein
MAADQGLIDSVANENVKVGAGAPVHYAASLMQAHAGHMARLNIIAENGLQGFLAVHQAATAAAVRAFTEMDALEAMSNAVIGQQGAKVAQSTPPETGKV